MTYGNYPDLSLVKRALIIKMRHHGDVLLTTPLFTNLKKAIPDATIDAFIYKDTLPMLEGHPAISEYLLYDKEWKKLSLFGKIKKEITLLKAIRSGGYDLVINLTEGDRGAIAARLSRAKVRVGFDPKIPSARKGHSHILSRRVLIRGITSSVNLMCFAELAFFQHMSREIFICIFLRRLGKRFYSCYRGKKFYPASTS